MTSFDYLVRSMRAQRCLLLIHRTESFYHGSSRRGKLVARLAPCYTIMKTSPTHSKVQAGALLSFPRDSDTTRREDPPPLCVISCLASLCVRSRIPWCPLLIFADQ